MIIDLPRFLERERPHWQRLEATLDKVEGHPGHSMSIAEVSEFHGLYRRASADLARLATFASEPELRAYLESLVARAYGEIHGTGGRSQPIRLWSWLTQTFPQTFRLHAPAFWLAVAFTAIGVAFGVFILKVDPDAKEVIMPFEALQDSPAARVKREESATKDRLQGQRSTFAAELMTHNTNVAVFTMALGLTWGAGTAISLFYNGVILGAVAIDYLQAGQARFLFGWLLPHGAIEIPSILVAGQAGFVLASALIGWGSRKTRRERLREVSPHLTTLIFGAGVMLIWAGIVEAFLSQYHEPVIPYALKIAFGAVELLALALFFWKGGANANDRI